MGRHMRGFVVFTWIAASMLWTSSSHTQAVCGEANQSKTSDCTNCACASDAKPVLPADRDLAVRKLKSKNRGLKHVWSNDDFAPAVVPAAVPQKEVPAKPPLKSAAETKAPAMDSPELQKAHDDVVSEMLATAKVRQKAYDDTITDVKAKLLTESSPNRIEIYKNILRDTQAMKEVNNKILEQFGKKPDAAPEQPAKAETDKPKNPEEVQK